MGYGGQHNIVSRETAKIRRLGIRLGPAPIEEEEYLVDGGEGLLEIVLDDGSFHGGGTKSAAINGPGLA